MPLKRHSGNLWRSTKESGSPSGTWWRARKGIQPNWRELGPQWSGDGPWKKRTRWRRMEMKRKGPRMAPKKVRRRGLCRLPSVSILVLFFFFNRIFFYFLFSVN